MHGRSGQRVEAKGDALSGNQRQKRVGEEENIDDVTARILAKFSDLV